MYKKHPTLPVEVSLYGELRCMDRDRKGNVNRNGYRRVVIAGKSYYVQHLVLETFIGPKPRGLVARFNDGDHGNCALSNLRWGLPHYQEEPKPRADIDAVVASTGLTRSKAKALIAMVRYDMDPRLIAKRTSTPLARVEALITKIKEISHALLVHPNI